MITYKKYSEKDEFNCRCHPAVRLRLLCTEHKSSYGSRVDDVTASAARAIIMDVLGNDEPKDDFDLFAFRIGVDDGSGFSVAFLSLS
jgi:hypothetical protein